ncbi:MAG: c-type cytochrome [Myxococcota bacterium]
MPDRDIVPADLGVTRLLWVFAGLSVALLAALAVAPARGFFAEWRTAQDRYNARARQPVAVGIKQIWKPELGVVDRCPSCHLAMDGAEALPGEPLFAAHPPVPHEPREFGCTPCHAGQGRATTAAAAHGHVRHWDEPIFEAANIEAGCGTCHSHIRVPSPALAERGRKLFHEYGCRDCHRGARDLATVGLRGFRADWHARHVGRTEGPIVFAPLADDDVPAVAEYLGTLVGAPRLIAGKTLAHELGCRGCHRIGGVGGDDGPDLSDVGRKVAADLDFHGVREERTLAGWLREHFVDPARVVPGSQMPDLGIAEAQADLLTVYMLSLRARDIPESLAPRDRVRAMRLGEREFATDGAALFGAFCASCHGPRGEGRRYGTLNVAFPAIGNPDFLALADDVLLRRTLVDGRPGRRMPAWGTKDGGLRAEEIDALVAHLRSLEPPAPTLGAVMAAAPDMSLGRDLFSRDCATCHGAAGEGTVLAPPLAAPDNLATKEDSRVYGTLALGVQGTAMGSFRRYDAAPLRSIIAFVRALPPADALRTGWAPTAGDARRGGDLYAKHCSGCHGAHGEGREAPALGTPAFLAAASDGYTAATIVRGREGTSMPAFSRPGPQHAQLGASQVADIVSFVRSLAPGAKTPRKEAAR